MLGGLDFGCYDCYAENGVWYACTSSRFRGKCMLTICRKSESPQGHGEHASESGAEGPRRRQSR